MAFVKFVYAVALVALYRFDVFANELEIPEECKDKMFCDVKPKFYDEYENNIKEKFLPIKNMWNLDEANDEYYEVKEVHSENNCKYKTQSVVPYVVQSNGTTKVIVQTDFYQQRLKTTECLNLDSPDSGDQCFQSLLGEATGRCRTKYTSIILYAYNNVKNSIERVVVEVPVCCYCAVSGFE